MASEHATGSFQPNQPHISHSEAPDNNHGNATTSSGENDPFLSREGSPNHRPTQAQSNIVQPQAHRFPLSPTSIERHGARENLGRQDNDYSPQDIDIGYSSGPVLGVRLADDQSVPRRQRTMNGNRLSAVPQSVRLSQAISGDSGFDPESEKVTSTVSSRIRTTVENAERERDKYASKAKLTGMALNVAIGLQVLLGSLTTGLSAVATTGRNAAVSTTILGAFATIVASYLARARGSNEPELSIARVKDLEQFLRECKNFETDHGLHTGHAFDQQLEYYRARFENLLGNGNEERRLSAA